MYSLFIIYILLLGFGTSVNLPLFGKEVQLADLFFVFIFVKLLLDIKRDSTRRLLDLFPAMGRLIIILLVLLLTASWFSSDKIKSFVEFSAIFYLLILYLWTARISMTNAQLERALNIWIYLTSFLCVLALGGFVTHSFFEKSNPFVMFMTATRFVVPLARVKATFTTMNVFSSYLHVSVVFLLTFVIHNKRLRWDYLISGVLIFACILLTASRNMLGIFVTIFLILIPIKGRPFFNILKYTSFALVIFLIIMVFVTIIWMIYPVEADYDKDNHRFNISFNTNPNLYAIFNDLSVDLIQKSPIVGVGPGVFNQKAKEDLVWEDVKDSYETEDIHRLMPFDPHNTYLGWAAEAGLPFILALLGLFYAISHLLWKAYKANSNSMPGWFCYACLCGLIGFIVNGFYVDILTMRHLWVMLGLGTMAGLTLLNHKKVV